jgi:peptide/nickel transport system permease protein
MMRHLARRLVWAVFIVWATTSLAFVVNNVLPSNPARMIAGPQARPQDVAKIRQQLGLDRPLIVQYGAFMKRLVHFAGASAPKEEHATCGTLGFLHVDFGRSYQKRQPVIKVIGERLPRTAGLALAALLIQVIVGTGLGAFAASRKGKLADHAAVTTSVLGISAPTFVTGLALQWLLAHRLAILPLDGFGQDAHEHLVCVILPALTLGIYGAAYYTRLVRDEMIGVMGQDHVRTARAKGVSRAGVWLKHGLRNALMPLVTMVGLDLGALLGGAIVTETLFRWPGIGALGVSAMLDRDGPMIMAIVIVSSTAIVLSNVFVDVAYALLDPRVRRAR